MTVLDAGPIVDMVQGRGGIGPLMGNDNLYEHDGQDRTVDTRRRFRPGEVKRWTQTYNRMVRSGTVTVAQADRFCSLVLRANPSVVFGPVWWVGVGEPDAVALAWLDGDKDAA